MRIDRLELTNFKRFAQASLELHPKFTLLAGVNGVGKTTWLDALSVAMGIWLESPPHVSVRNCKRKLWDSEARLLPDPTGDRTQFRPQTPVKVRATGTIVGNAHTTWVRQTGTRRVQTYSDLRPALQLIEALYEQDRQGQRVLCPVIAYYGAGRAWLPSNRRIKRPHLANSPALRWQAFYDWCNERIRFDDLKTWFSRETIEMGNRQGRRRPGFEAVIRVVLGCVPKADRLWYDPDRGDIVFSIAGESTPFENLSAGQRMMLALVADIAIRCVTQNAWLLPPEQLDGSASEPPAVLAQTPGVVLIDELDVHLHPAWQRRVATDLIHWFPAIQFVATSHSPQIIGELQPDQIRLLTDNGVELPGQSFGLDSNLILQTLMGVAELNEGVKRDYEQLFTLLTQRPLDAAEAKLRELQAKLGKTPPLQRAASTLERIRMLAR